MFIVGIPIELTEVGLYAVNGTLVTNNVAGSILFANDYSSLIYNGTTYAAGEFTIDAAGNGIGLAASADIIGDYLPNYADEYTDALILNDAGTLDNQLSEILPANADLGEIDFDPQPDKLSTEQIVIAAAALETAEQ